MSYIHWLVRQLRTLHRLSKIAILLGFTLMTLFLAIAALARLLAPLSGDYLFAMSLMSGALEAAPACLAVGVCAGLLGDLMLRHNRH